MPNTSFVAYYRASTSRQGQSGLGLDAQRQAVREYLGGKPDSQLVAEHTEIESGKRSDRPELQTALATCKRLKATLIIAKLDRLARNVAFIANLTPLDMPTVLRAVPLPRTLSTEGRP
jgi:DNA invertase Pin-like site-specific DNA recombinase